MRIHFLGATRTTTGSMFLFEINGRKLLLECGLYQGHRDESIARNCCFSFKPSEVDAVVLSHAHIDHCGNLPNLVKQGFTGNIFCTDATRDLAAIMLTDSAKIQKDDAEFVSRQRAKKGLPPVEPLYGAEHAEQAIKQFVTLSYDRPIPVVDGVTATFRDAGHILGAAQVILDVREGGRKFRYLFSGDVGRGNDEILRDPQPVENVDFLQIESTYGDRVHEEKALSKGELANLVRETTGRGGKVIIPAFSVGRTQLIVYVLNQLFESGALARVPVFVDSPLSTNATEVYRLHAECFNDKIAAFLRDVANPFGMENLTYIRESTNSRKLNDLEGPAIIISASGMAEAGRIRHHLKTHIGNANNLILFIGFCAAHTLGAQIRAGRSPVNIFGEPHAVRAKVAAIDAFSGHADKIELRRYVRALTGNIKKVFVVHGEETQALAWGKTMQEILPNAEVRVPVYKETAEV